MAEPELIRRFNVRVPLRDGITLSADLVTPAARPAPVIVMRTPYGKSGEQQAKRARPSRLLVNARRLPPG